MLCATNFRLGAHQHVRHNLRVELGAHQDEVTFPVLHFDEGADAGACGHGVKKGSDDHSLSGALKPESTPDEPTTTTHSPWAIDTKSDELRVRQMHTLLGTDWVDYQYFGVQEH